MNGNTVVQGEPRFPIEALKFDQAVAVLPSLDCVKASRFLLPIPAFEGEELLYPDHYPADMRNRDGSLHPQAGLSHPKAGHPLEDWRGRPRLHPDGSVPRGVVFFNYEDGLYQGVESDGDRILIFDRPTRKQAKQLEDYIASLGGPGSLTSVARVVAVLRFAQQLGLDDRYDSSRTYAQRSLTALAEVATGIPGYGLHVRANEMVRAVFVPGPAQVGDLLLGSEGGVFLLISTNEETRTRDIRSVSPSVFAETYTARDGTRITVRDLPAERPWEVSGAA